MDILRLQRTLAVGRLFFLASEHGSESAGKTWIFQFNRKIPMEWNALRNPVFLEGTGSFAVGYLRIIIWIPHGFQLEIL